MPPPASESKPVPRSEDTLSERLSSLENQARWQKESDTLLEDPPVKGKAPESSETGPELSGIEAQERLQEEPRATLRKDDTSDSINRVPDEQLPSHRERQRWDFSKRFSDFMDDLLPKLAVVTQKVNTYTGTDYSGVAALRREIKEQENLVKTRRRAIDTAKQALDITLAHQASSQKEVVALLERKHSWAAGDLERYMSLIRSEHINDQAVREAKEAVDSSESALEEARSQLEKRERAQYHEEQIWSDTIRRNSTWVTFGLMGVNIFLLLLSLAILEPWRRRRMVKEIKNALEAHKTAMEAVPALAPTLVATPAPGSGKEDLTGIDKVFDENAPVQTTTPAPAVTEAIIEASPPAGTGEAVNAEPSSVSDAIPEELVEPTPDPAVPGAAPLTLDEAELSPQASINIAEEASTSDGVETKLQSWHEKVTAVVQDVVSDRVISIRRVDYTTAILQGAAAGAVITAAIIAMLRPN
ncbi:mitochondrion biogenesis protein [Cucurbitaria berberidis CBS 394.84]|uniref:Sensitive to high expression protein 9, mitochondrial n=1 Tax=Cucurbitaria berberidis CBS 394.84 TaxID=1168544 RepID=A0A9P4L9P7_9PLEO|nr:mitochondrion biogenesis protein [Cucurbitaria berberidis CBS 394.84]KAF1846577.1 mitochondrion biogenesis protein [Cucurbitaria berberidis CBS 394.84]